MAFLLLAPLAAFGEEMGTLALSSLETRDVRLIHPSPMLDYLDPHALRTFANSLAWQKRIFGWEPYERTTVFLKDFSDFGNASATALPVNSLSFDIAPLSLAFETYPASERMYSLMNHELVHVATMDMSTDGDRRWRLLLGGKVSADARHPETLLYSYLTAPRFTVPRWYLEGSATFMETWMGGGLGRAQGGYDEMVFRAMVRDGAHFYGPLGLVSRGTRVDFQVGVNAYLYGTRFFTWLAYAHGPERVVAWLKRDKDSRRYYSDNFQQVFGIPLERAWQDWIDFEHDFQKRNLEEVRKHPVTPHRELVPSAVGSVSRAYYDEKSGVLYAGFRYPGVLEHVGALDTRTGNVRRLADIKGAMLYRVTSLAWDPDTQTLFYTTDNYALRDIVALDVRTGSEQMVLENARIGEIVFDRKDRALYGIRHANGLATLVRIPHPYAEWNQVHTFPYGVVPYDLDVSPDGRLLSASCSEVNGDQYLRVWEIEKLRAGDAKPFSEFRFGQSVPESFVFSPDGRSLYGSSYYTGVSNIFRYDVASGMIEAVSNAESGFFRPVPLPDGRLVVFHYTGAGFVPAVIEPRPLQDVSAIRFLGAELAAKHPIVTTWQVPSPSTADPAAVAITGGGPYFPMRNLGLHGAYPVVQGYKDSIALGWHVTFEDPLHFGAVGVTGAYTVDGKVPAQEKGHVNIDYRYLGWRAGLSWNRSDFYDLFGPTRLSRKGYAARLGYDYPIVFDLPRRLDFKSEVAYYDQLDALPSFQNVSAPFHRLITAETSLSWSLLRKSLGAVDDEKGLAWTLVLGASVAHDDVIPQVRAGLDFGFPLPIPHSSLWFRSAAGASGGERGDPFASFFFGGFGNNYVDSRSIQRYQGYDSFPGFELNQIGAHDFVRQMVEAKLPPFVFETAGTPALYLTWLRLALFASALWTDPDVTGLRDPWASAGAQLDLRFTFLHWYDMTLSTGYALGFRGTQRSGHEWMVSLKIL
ncbi:MAG TPA: hypothetical protein VE755_11785 [Myxococcales bacterium]|nr:hypothetical protein [Myxococcales bacterium]